MNESNEHEAVWHLLSSYALETTDDAERRRVEMHVARCAECHTELASLLHASEQLAFAAPQRAMPNDVRTSIMSEIDSLVRVEGSHQRLSHVGAASQQQVPRTMARRWWHRSWAVPVLAGACSVLVIALTVQTVRIGQASQEPSSRSPQIQAAAGNSMIDDAHVIPVSTSGELGESVVEFIDIHGAGMLVTKNLPKAPSGYEWRVWGVTADHSMRPKGTLEPVDEKGMGIQPVPGIHETGIEGIAITLSPKQSPLDEGDMVGYAQMA